MKNINFIRALPNKHKKSITLWAIISLGLSGIVIATMSILSISDFLILNALQKEHTKLSLSVASFNAIMQRKQTLKKQEQTLKEKLNFITNASQQTQQHASLMVHIKKSLKNVATLESIILEPAVIQLCIDCAQTQQASEIISSITKLPNITGLHVNSLQPKQQGATTALRLNLRGTIKPS